MAKYGHSVSYTMLLLYYMLLNSKGAINNTDSKETLAKFRKMESNFKHHNVSNSNNLSIHKIIKMLQLKNEEILCKYFPRLENSVFSFTT